MKKRVAVAMSGGVDSSVASYILKEQGYEVAGFFMRNGIFSSEALNDAQKVARYLSIEFHDIDLRKEFEGEVVGYFIDEYKNARTPNPCAICNRYVKFGVFTEKIREIWPFDLFATGHYAKTVLENGWKYLCISDSDKKDQSYFLSTVSKEILDKTVFPLADFKKEKTRKIAVDAGLPVAGKGDSQEICFVPLDDYRGFLKSRGIVMPSGDIVRENGKVIGKHEGIHSVTVGQRKGLNFSAERKLYVKKIDKNRNEVEVAPADMLYSDLLEAEIINVLVEPESLSEYIGKTVKCRIRTGSPLAECSVELNGGILKVKFTEKQFAITPGQLCVVYDDGKVLLSSVIL